MVSQENLAFVHCRLGQYELARTIFLKNLEIALKSDHLGIDITACLLGLASIAMAEGAAPLAAKVLGAIDATKEPLVFFATDQSEYERISSATKALLGDQQFGELFKEGEAVGEAQVARIFLNPQSKESTSKAKLLRDLTKREIEVLRLVAQGLSDAQVAEHLVLSPRTVNAHLTSVYRKLDVNSRAAATRFAIEHGLA
jgi:DNA-binding NarL/FixJ family response regulator